MDVNEAIDLYSNEPESGQVRFLSYLGHQITIHARDTYEVGGDSLENPIQLRCINEIMHRILGQQSKILRGDSDRYPDDTFIRAIFDMAATCNFEGCLSSSLKDCFELCADKETADRLA